MASIRRRNGKYQVQVRIGRLSSSRSFHRLTDAKEWARITETDLVQRAFLGKKYQPETFRQILSRYLKEKTPEKLSSQNESIVIRSLLRERWTEIPLKQLSINDLTYFRDQRLLSVKPATLKRQFNIIKHACAVAEDEWDWEAPRDLFNKLNLPKIVPRPVRRITNEDEARLLNELSRRRSKWPYHVTRFALATAMRRGEILALEWAHIDLARHSAFLMTSKTGFGREVPLSQDAIEILGDIGGDLSGPVFKTSANAVRLAFSRAKGAAGLKYIRFHDLRHEAISRFFEMGLTQPEIALISGHRTIEALSIYAHADRSSIKKKLLLA